MILRVKNENNVFTDVLTETMRAKIVCIGIGDSEDNYKEIDKNTPLPEINKYNNVPELLDMTTEETDDSDNAEEEETPQEIQDT